MKKFIYGIEISNEKSMLICDLYNVYTEPIEQRLISLFFDNYLKIVPETLHRTDAINDMIALSAYDLLVEKYYTVFDSAEPTDLPDRVLINRLCYIYNAFFMEYTIKEYYFYINYKKNNNLAISTECINGMSLYTPLSYYSGLIGKCILGIEVKSDNIREIDSVSSFYNKELLNIKKYIGDVKFSVYMCN